MKQTIISVFCLSLLSATIIFWMNDYQETQLDTLEGKNRILATENKQLKAELSYDQDLVITQLDDDFRYWSYIEETAEQMVADSDGQFKRTWAIYLVSEAEQREIDPFLIYELLKVETGHTFDPELIGPKTKYGHAYGMAQFMKNTAPWIAKMADLPYNEELLFDPYYSMKLSIVYLDFLHHQYQDWDQALTAYHRGMAGMENYKREKGTARSHYADQIQTNAKAHHTVAMAE